MGPHTQSIVINSRKLKFIFQGANILPCVFAHPIGQFPFCSRY